MVIMKGIQPMALRNNRAQGLVEYALILAIICVVIYATVTMIPGIGYSTTQQTIKQDGMTCIVLTTWRFGQMQYKSMDCVNNEDSSN